MTDAVLGIDIGTQSTKAVLMSGVGALIASSIIEHAVNNPAPGCFEHDAEAAWWSGPVLATRRVLADAGPGVAVAAVGLSACGPCIVPVDAAGNALRPAILYGVDTRASEQIARFERLLGPAAILSAYGMPITSQTAGPKIDWLIENEPDVYARTTHLLTANSYLASRLTDHRCIDHHQAAYFAPYYRDGQWDSSHDESGILAKLPELRWSNEIVGAVTSAAAVETGLPEGVPVVIGSSDGLTGAYGAGVHRSSRGVINYGTTLGITVFSSQAETAGGVWRTPGAVADQMCLVAGLSTGGVLTTWFRDVFAGDLPSDDIVTTTAAFQQLAAEAAGSPPGASGLLLLPYFAGERTPIYDPDAAGVLLGLRLHHSRGDLYRAVLEGTAFGVRHVLEEMGRMDAAVESLRSVGGGTATRLWQQIVSDVTGIRQEIVSPHHGAPVGAALLAALGTDLTTGTGAVEKWVAISDEITPDPDVRDVYDARFATYLSAYERTRPLITELKGK
jgi:xylulokinase